MAEFTFKHAVMTAGKSRELARIHYTFNQKGHLALVIIPTTDTRAKGKQAVIARSGEEVSAIAVEPGEMKETLESVMSIIDDSHARDKVRCILIDEVQFFKKEDIFAIKEIACLKRNIPVMAFGLKSDFQNNMFEGSSASLVVAERIEEIETMCAFCNEKAIMNMRFKDGAPIKEGEQVQIGDEEYKPVCHKHYNDETIRIKANKSEDYTYNLLAELLII